MAKFKIRQANAQDIPKVLQLARNARARIGTWPSFYQSVQSYVAQQRHRFLLVSYDAYGTFSGFCFGRRGSRQSPGSRIYVLASCSSGTGQALLQAAPKKCTALVSIRNERSQRCFTRAGFLQAAILETNLGKKFYVYIRGC